jgi:hypothetical protein
VVSYFLDVLPPVDLRADGIETLLLFPFLPRLEFSELEVALVLESDRVHY